MCAGCDLHSSTCRCVCLSGTFAYLRQPPWQKAKPLQRSERRVFSLSGGAVALCFFVSASLFLPHACMSLSRSVFSLLLRRPKHQLFLIRLLSAASLCDLGALLPWSASPGFCSLLFLPQPTLSTFTYKGQVGIRVDTHLNKEQPTKLQIYAPVCRL